MGSKLDQDPSDDSFIKFKMKYLRNNANIKNKQINGHENNTSLLELTMICYQTSIDICIK